MALGTDGSLYIVGTTRSRNFPVSHHAFQRESGGGSDAFCARVDDGGRVLLFGTLVGGTRDEQGFGVAVGNGGHAHIVGRTDSSDFPTTTSTFDDERYGTDGFVTKLSHSGDRPSYSTLLGGRGRDEAHGVAVGDDGHAWIAGWTDSDDFPITLQALGPSRRGKRDGFLFRLSGSGSLCTYGTYVGGRGDDELRAVTLDSHGTAWAVGMSESENLPLSADATQFESGGGRDALLLGVDSSSGALAFGTYLGRSGQEEAHGLAVHPISGDVFVVGQAEDMAPDERGPLSGGRRGPSDALVARFEQGLCGVRAEFACSAPGPASSSRAARRGWGAP